jgi:hypothetical protein
LERSQAQAAALFSAFIQRFELGKRRVVLSSR